VNDVIHRAVNADIGRQGSAVHALHGSGVMHVPDASVVSAHRHHPSTFRKTEKPEQSERRHDDGGIREGGEWRAPKGRKEDWRRSGSNTGKGRKVNEKGMT